MADELKLIDILDGDWVTKAVKLVVSGVSDSHKKKLLSEIQQGKALHEFHTKAGLRSDPIEKFQKRQLQNGKMTLRADGNWKAYAQFTSNNKDYQVNFAIHVDEDDPSKSYRSLLMAEIGSQGSPKPSTSFTVITLYFKFDTDSQPGSPLSIAGELGVSYSDLTGQIRTIKFTTEKNTVIG